MSAKAVTYAEDTLGVHVVYERAQELQAELGSVGKWLVDARVNKRNLETKLSDIEMEVAITERGKHPDMSQAAMDKHLKAHNYANAEWKSTRNAILEVTNTIDALEFEKHSIDSDLRLATSRLNELGGYLQYLAAVKSANT